MAEVDKKKLLRAIDANLNRAVEGVRVVEDAVRFVCGAADTTAALRGIRHSLRAGARLLPGGAAALVGARDSAGDVARNAPPETPRESLANIVSANLKRAQEAARALEEFAKPLAPAAAAHFGEARFRIYDIEKDIQTAVEAAALKQKMPRGHFLHAIATYDQLAGHDGKWNTLDALVAAKTGMLQLREKNIEDGELLRRAREVAERLKGSGTLLVVNDRVDIALAAGADVVHVGQHDLPLEWARRIAGGRLLTGYSTHSEQEADCAIELAPDYIAVGAVFPSPTKPENETVGTAFVNKVKEKTDIPIVAIGGVTPENAGDVFAAGARGAAMISGIFGAADLEAALDEINEAIAAADDKYL